jgi:hypothetical protein
MQPFCFKNISLQGDLFNYICRQFKSKGYETGSTVTYKK